MAYTDPHYLVTISGTLGAPVMEIWQTTMRLWKPASTPGATEAARQSFLTSLDTALAAFMASSTVNMGTNTVATQLKIVAVGTNGKYLTDTELPSIKAITRTGIGTPNQSLTSALVISLRTIRPRGRAAFGRMYWPMCALTIAADGLISTTVQTNVLNASKTFYDAVNTAANTLTAGTQLAVMSEVGVGTSAFVSKVGVGREPDVITRRKSATKETHAFANLA